MFLLVDLDDTDHGLAIDLRVVVNDDVEAGVDGDDSSGSESLQVWQLRLLQLDVVGRRDCLLLLVALPVLL